MARAAAETLRKMAEHFQPRESQPQADVGEATPSENSKTISLSDLKISREELLGSLFLPIAQAEARVQMPSASGMAKVMPPLPTHRAR